MIRVSERRAPARQVALQLERAEQEFGAPDALAARPGVPPFSSPHVAIYGSTSKPAIGYGTAPALSRLDLEKQP